MDAVGHDVLTIHHLALEDDPRYGDNEEYIAMTRGLPKAVTIFDLLNLVAAVSEAVGEKAGKEIYLAYLQERGARRPLPAATGLVGGARRGRLP